MRRYNQMVHLVATHQVFNGTDEDGPAWHMKPDLTNTHHNTFG